MFLVWFTNTIFSYADTFGVSRGFRARAREPRVGFRAARESRQTDGRDRPTSRLPAPPPSASREHLMSPKTLGGETHVQGRALIQYESWPRPPSFVAPKAMLRRITDLMGGRFFYKGAPLCSMTPGCELRCTRAIIASSHLPLICEQ